VTADVVTADSVAAAAPPPGDAPGWRRAIAGALPTWIGSRIALALLSVVAGWLIRPGNGDERPGFLEQWDRWDVGLFRKVAEFGYFSPAYKDLTEPFFPGQPMLMRAVHLLVRDWIATGLIVSLVAGGVASVMLWRLAAEENGPVAGRRAVLYLVLFPYAVFLFAGYSEAVFLAFVTSSWWAARQERWWLAGLLAAGATATRITGAVFAVALVVQYISQRVAARPAGAAVTSRGTLQRVFSPEALWLALPALPVFAYFSYLHSRTGHWDAYTRALETGWGRTSVSPLRAFNTTWDQATNYHQSAQFLWSWRAELLAMLLGVLLTVVLLVVRRWGEATYVGLNVALLSTSSYYASCTRSALVWFPLYLLLARWSLSRRWLHEAVVWVCAPLMFGIALAFSQGSWIG
jgi:hypothetical protein